MGKGLLPDFDDKDIYKLFDKGFNIIKWYSILSLIGGLTIVGLFIYILVRVAIVFSKY